MSPTRRELFKASAVAAVLAALPAQAPARAAAAPAPAIEAITRISVKGAGDAWWRVMRWGDEFMLSIAPYDGPASLVTGSLSMTVGELLEAVHAGPGSSVVDALFGRPERDR